MVTFKTGDKPVAEEQQQTQVPTQLNLQEKIDVINRECQLVKTAEAGQKYTWKFIPLPDLMAMLKPYLRKYSLRVNWKYDVIGEHNAIMLIVRDTITGESDSSMLLMPSDEDYQEVGKRMTYYINRLIVGLFGLVAEDDTGGEAEAERKSSSRRSTSRRASVPDDEDEDEEDIEDDDEDEDEEVEETPRRSSNRRSASSSRRTPSRRNRGR